jgi:hypothetical protein
LNQKRKLPTRSTSRNATPAPGSIWIDRDASGANYSDYHSYTPEEFIKKIFVKDADKLGSAINDVIKNVKFTGVGWDESTQTWTANDRSLHYFDNGDTTSMVKSYDGVTDVPRFGISNGFLLATGGGLLAEGLNQSTGDLNGGLTTTNYGGSLIPDADLQGTITQLLTTQTILEFDFKPYVDSVSFKYVFASTEFKNYSNSAYNDAFGFFVTGSDLEDAWGNTGTTINIARYPNGVPIAVNTSNWGYRGDNTFAAYDYLGATPVSETAYSNNRDAVSPDYHLAVYSSGRTTRSAVVSYQDCDTTLMEYDGHSIVLTARVKLNRGEWYHMKLAIGNASDGSLGSGTYLMAGSFDLGAPESDVPRPYAQIPYDSIYGWSSIYAGCDNSLELTFPASATEQNIYVWSGGSGANFAYDPELNKYFNDSIKYVVPANDSTLTVQFKVDDQVENGSQLWFYSMIEFSANQDTSEVFDLYTKSKTEVIKYYKPTATYAGVLDIQTTNGSPYIQRSLDGGLTWEFARDTVTGEMKPFTKSQIANLASEEDAYIIYREPNTCCENDTLFIGKGTPGMNITRTVTMPAISGATVDKIPGDYTVNSTDNFTFTITPTGDNANLQLVVTTSRTSIPDSEGVIVVKNADGSYTVTIRQVQETIEIYVDFVTSNLAIGNNKIWANGSMLYMQTDQVKQAQIYTIAGALVQTVNLTSAETATISLPKGFYIVAVDDSTYKVIIK